MASSSLPASDTAADTPNNNFMMYIYKVQLCNRFDPHDWSSCPFAHEKEKCARRPPYLYGPSPCPAVKIGTSCPLGSECPLAHNVFETGLHPTRYRTQLCLLGRNCPRRICFFAHSRQQLRKLEGATLPKSHESLAADAESLDSASYQPEQESCYQQPSRPLTERISSLLSTRSARDIPEPSRISAGIMGPLLVNPNFGVTSAIFADDIDEPPHLRQARSASAQYDQLIGGHMLPALPYHEQPWPAEAAAELLLQLSLAEQVHTLSQWGVGRH